MDGKMIDETLDAILAEYERNGPALHRRARITTTAQHLQAVASTTLPREWPELPPAEWDRAARLIGVAVERLLTRILPDA